MEENIGIRGQAMALVNALVYKRIICIKWPSKFKMHVDKFWWHGRWIFLHGDCCVLVNELDHHDQWVQWEFYWCLTCISDYRWDRLLVLISIDQCTANNRATERLDYRVFMEEFLHQHYLFTETCLLTWSICANKLMM